VDADVSGVRVPTSKPVFGNRRESPPFAPFQGVTVRGFWHGSSHLYDNSYLIALATDTSVQARVPEQHATRILTQ
jgi:hypothetical protein